MMFAVDARSIHRNSATKREQILAWVRVHDLDPNRVHAVRVIGPFIRVREYEINDQGRKFLRAGKPAMRTRWMWLRRLPPGKRAEL